MSNVSINGVTKALHNISLFSVEKKNCIINLHTFTHCCMYNFLHHIMSCHSICQLRPKLISIALKFPTKFTFYTVMYLYMRDFVEDAPSNINLWCKWFLFERVIHSLSHTYTYVHNAKPQELISTTIWLHTCMHWYMHVAIRCVAFSASLSLSLHFFLSFRCVNTNLQFQCNYILQFSKHLWILSIYEIGNEKSPPKSIVSTLRFWLFGAKINWTQTVRLTRRLLSHSISSSRFMSLCWNTLQQQYQLRFYASCPTIILNNLNERKAFDAWQLFISTFTNE